MQEQARSKCQELSNEENDIKREYRRKRYRNISDKDKQRLKEYQEVCYNVKHNFVFIYSIA